jgi:fucose 4-O-acetylase-like acetyltransferase
MNDSRTESETIPRTGAIGRLARLVLAGVFVVIFLSFVGPAGSAQFRNPHILGEPLAWFLHLTMFVIFVILVGALAQSLAGPEARRRWQVGAVLVSIVTIAIAAGIGKVTSGSLWGFPLADLVWWFDALIVVEQFIALVLAAALAMPGCEIGVWPHLLAKLGLGNARSEDTLACIVGLHLLDAWEARRRVAMS